MGSGRPAPDANAALLAAFSATCPGETLPGSQADGSAGEAAAGEGSALQL